MSGQNLLPHYVLIRSSYTDPELSRRRLELTKLTLAPCLKHQRTPFVAVLKVSDSDPYLGERIRLFERVCPELRIVHREGWGGLMQDSGPRLVTRADDDDCLASWFSERLQTPAQGLTGDAVLFWPNGYILADKPRWWSSETNQFQTLFTTSPDPGETPFREHHAHVRNRWPVVAVDTARAWCWTQHENAKTFQPDRNWSSATEELRPVRHFAADFATIARHLSGQPLTTYQQALNDWTLDIGRPSMTITPKLWQTIRNTVKPKMRTLECGSGLSTVLFDRLTKNHTALEHDAHWSLTMDSVSSSVSLCRIDESTGWYAWRTPRPYDLILIDGPTGTIGRAGILSRLSELTHRKTILIVDDTHRPAESELAGAIAQRLGRKSRRAEDCGKAFDVI